MGGGGGREGQGGGVGGGKTEVEHGPHVLKKCECALFGGHPKTKTFSSPHLSQVSFSSFSSSLFIAMPNRKRHVSWPQYLRVVRRAGGGGKLKGRVEEDEEEEGKEGGWLFRRRFWAWN